VRRRSHPPIQPRGARSATSPATESSVPISSLLPDLLAVGALLVLVATVFGDLVLSPNRVVSHSFGDVFRFFLPYRSFGYRELAAGNLPLWNPHLFSGTPFVGGFQSAMFYPPNLIHLVLPTATAVNLEVVLSVSLLGLLMYAWARSRGLDAAAATVSAAVLIFSGPFTLRIMAGQLTVLATLAWTPLLFLTIDRVLARPSLGWGLCGVFAGTMQMLAGYPALVLMTYVAAAIYLAFALPRSPSPGRAGISLLTIATAPLLLAGVQLYPGLETTAESVRGGGGSFVAASQFSFPPENLITLFAPAFLGDLTRVPYWGRTAFWDASVFMGTGGLALALVGACSGRRYERMNLALPAVGLVALGFGYYTPLYGFLYSVVPGFSLIRAPSKFLFFATMFLSLLAGFGARRVLHGQRAPRLAAGVATLALTLLPIATVFHHWASAGLRRPFPELLGFAQADRAQFHWLDAQLQSDAVRLASLSLMVGGVSCVLIAVLLWRVPQSRRARAALMIFTVLEVAAFARMYRGEFETGTRTRGRIDALYAALPTDVRTFDLGGGPAATAQNRCMDVGGSSLWGYDPIVLRRYAELVACTQPARADAWLLTTLYQPRRYHPLFAMLRCGAVVQPRPQDRHFMPPTQRPPASDQLCVPSDRDDITYEPDAYPRFLFVNDYRVTNDPHAALTALCADSFDGRRTVMLEEEPPVRPASGPALGRVRLVDRSTDHVTLKVSVDRETILLVTDAYSSGWRADSQSSHPPQTYRVMPANHALQAIPLRHGRHAIRLEYRPIGFLVGAWVSAISAAGYVLAVAWWWGGRRTRTAAKRPPTAA
jgi:hypothetical protein